MKSVNFHLVKLLLLSLLASQITFESAYGEHFLFFFVVSTYSHRIPVWPLVEKLIDQGHQVTFISPFPPKPAHYNPKVKEFQPDAVKKFHDAHDEGGEAIALRQTGINNMDESWWILNDWGLETCRLFLESPDMPQWFAENKFDLIIIDSLYNDCGLGIAYKYGAPHILFGTSSLFMWHFDSYGIPGEASWIPDMQYHFPEKSMNFKERFWTVYNQLTWAISREFDYMPKLTELLRDKLGLPNMPSVREIEKNASLVLLNSHFSEEYARSLPPLVVPVAGMHIKEKASPLPKEFEDFIKAGKEGFVYISFGSAVKFTAAPPEIQEAFYNAIRQMPNIQFIWKWEAEPPSDLPKNLFLQKWMPQQDILGHPKIRAFVSHSGLMSIQEAISFGVPVLSFPVFAEQDYNAERIHSREVGIRLEITTVSADQFLNALKSVISNPKYKKNMMELSKRFKDRPMKPADTALWWTEYVLRHKETAFLRPGSMYQNMLVRRSLDVYFALFALFTLPIFCIVALILVLMFRNSGGKKGEKQRSRKFKSS